MKKIFGMALGMLTAAAVVMVTPASVKAEGMPCTEATLKGFLEYQTKCEQELAQAEAAKASADANVAALRAQGVTGLELQQATDAAFNAGNVVETYKHKLNGAKANVAGISGRGKVEQYYLDMEAKWKDRCAIDGTQVQYEAANQLAAGALNQLKILQGELAAQQANAAANPALAGNVAALQAQVSAAEANYATLKANADALLAQYQQQKSTLNWATNEDNNAYGAFVANYGKALGKTVEFYNSKGEVVHSYVKYGEGQADWDGKTYTYDVVKEPNEWSIRWFE